MTEAGRTPTWQEKIENNFWAIVSSAAMAGVGVLIGATPPNDRLDKIEERLGKIERRQNSAIRNLDRVNDKLGIEPPQPLETME